MRVVIVSSQPLCRDALSDIARQDLGADPVVTTADLGGVPSTPPIDLLLLDLPTSADPARWIGLGAAPPAAKRVLVTPERDIALARLAHARGYHGLLPKSTETPVMAAALKLVLAGGEYFPCFEALAAEHDQLGAAPMERLSARQREVLTEIEHGRTNKEIAKKLGISVATVKLHVQAILAATGARNRTEAASRLNPLS
jgi:two-component system nitrate/nitrite response regulator NarL